MAFTVEEATRMMDAAERGGVRLYVAESICYSPMARFLREEVATGRRIGEVDVTQADAYTLPSSITAKRVAWAARDDREEPVLLNCILEHHDTGPDESPNRLP